MRQVSGTAAGGDVQVPRGGIYRWRKAEPQDIGTRIGKDNAVLRELHRSVVTKRELSNIIKLSVFKSIFVLILTCGHESWVMTERILTQVQAPKLGFFRRVHGVTKGRTEVRLRPVQETSLAPSIFQLKLFWVQCPALKKKLVTLLRFFGATQWFGLQGIVLPLLRLWCETSRQGAQLWNLQCPECRITSRNWENTTTLVRPDIQNAH